jgi:hypothetical protein
MCVLQFSACTLWRERDVVGDFSNATGGQALERSFWESVRAKDWKELEKHIADNYITVTPRERFNRDEALQQLKGMQLQSYTISDLTTNLNTETIVVTCTIDLQGTENGQPMSGMPLHLMGVWQKQKAGWMLLAHSLVQ